MSKKILEIGQSGFQLKVQSPFIACMHHKDQFPQGNEKMEPIHYIRSRIKGNDFNPRADWRMYHGDTIPGFPVHPHRGFETVTIVQVGFVDHADGLGATGRYGNGDVQWMTAGEGLQHAEMFPLLDEDNDNPMELFQVWLNLSKEAKFCKPHYNMLWNEQIPVIREKDHKGYDTSVRLIAGTYKNQSSPKANPDSWASDPSHHVGIWIITLAPYASFTIPAVSSTLNRSLFFIEGQSMELEGNSFQVGSYAELSGNDDIVLKNGAKKSQLLLLEGEPINEPIVSYGPFVMNTEKEIMEAYEDYKKTEFGGWPWDIDDPVNPKSEGRFARYSDGRVERP